MKRKWWLYLEGLPDYETRVTWSTCITLLRIILVPAIVYGLITASWCVAFTLFVFAALTDFFDGKLARLRNEQTILGAFLDPVADKLLLIFSYGALWYCCDNQIKIPALFLLLFLIREIIIIGGFFAIYISQKYKVMKPTFLGKCTTFTHMGFIALVLALRAINYPVASTLKVGIAWLSLFMVVSCGEYIYRGYGVLKIG